MLRRLKHYLTGQNWNYLEDVSGVIHVGANSGQERAYYNDLNLDILWIEPIPEVFKKLEINIQKYPKQKALQALITDQDGDTHTLHIAKNDGESSSIFELDKHKDIWPDIHFIGDIELKSITLPSLLKREQISPCRYQVLVLDTQGAELLILQGATPLLKNFKYIKTEAWTFSAYKECCQLHEIESFMKKHGFKEMGRVQTANRDGTGASFDIDYKRMQ